MGDPRTIGIWAIRRTRGGGRGRRTGNLGGWRPAGTVGGIPGAARRRNQIAQIAGTGGGTLGWDANGNLTSDGQTTPTNYVYDAENRLISTSGAKTATLTYDPMGRLYQVTDAAGSQRFLYDGDRLILEYNVSGVVQRRYAHGANVDELADDN